MRRLRRSFSRNWIRRMIQSCPTFFGIDLGKLGPKKENLCRVINPNQQHNQRARCAIAGTERRPSQVEPKKEFSQSEQDRRQDSSYLYVSPTDLCIWQVPH